MEFIDSFIAFVNMFLSFEIFGLPLYSYLFIFTFLLLVINMIRGLKDKD